MAHLKGVAAEYYESSKLAKYPFEPYWPEKKLRICVTGAGGFIASHLAKRLKAEGHYIIGCDWKRNEHMPVCCSSTWFTKARKEEMDDSVFAGVNHRWHIKYISYIHLTLWCLVVC